MAAAFLISGPWDGYQPTRDRVYDIIRNDEGRAPVDNVVVLSVDLHSSSAADLTQDPNNPVVAAGAYDPLTSPGVDDPGRGYMLVDVAKECAVCGCWFVDTVAGISNIQTFGTAFEVRNGSNHRVASVQTDLPRNAPLFAPGQRPGRQRPPKLSADHVDASLRWQARRVDATAAKQRVGTDRDRTKWPATPKLVVLGLVDVVIRRSRIASNAANASVDASRMRGEDGTGRGGGKRRIVNLPPHRLAEHHA